MNFHSLKKISVCILLSIIAANLSANDAQAGILLRRTGYQALYYRCEPGMSNNTNCEEAASNFFTTHTSNYGCAAIRSGNRSRTENGRILIIFESQNCRSVDQGQGDAGEGRCPAGMIKVRLTRDDNGNPYELCYRRDTQQSRRTPTPTSAATPESAPSKTAPQNNTTTTVD